MAFSLSLIAGFKAGLIETASSQNRFFHPSPKGYLEKLNQLIACCVPDIVLPSNIIVKNIFNMQYQLFTINRQLGI